MTEPRRCKAVRDYAARSDDELTFKEGDIVFVPQRTDGPMWKGVFNGRAGWFPKIYVDDLTVEIKEPGKVTRVRAIREYVAENDSQLSFTAGSVMFVAARVDAKWFQGVHGGKSGLIPASHVQDASDTDTLKRKTGKAIVEQFSGLKCKAVRSRLALVPGELTIKIGDTVFVPKASSDQDTWQGVSNNEVGTFDKSYVMDTAAHTKEEIEAAIEANKLLPEEGEMGAKVDEFRSKAKEIVQKRSGSLSMPPSLAPVFAPPPSVPEGEGKKEEEEEEEEGPPNLADPTGDEPPAAAPPPPSSSAPPPPSSPPPPASPPSSTDPAPAPKLSEKELKALKKKEEEEAKKRKKEEETKKKEEEKRAKEEEKRKKEEEKKLEKERQKAEKEAAKKK